MASVLGRAYLTLGSLEMLTAEPLPIPALSLAGRTPSGAVIPLDVSSSLPDFNLWPEFHNGVAAGLRLRHSIGSVTRNWILYNRPAQPSGAHAGTRAALRGLDISSHRRSHTYPDIVIRRVDERYMTVNLIISLALLRVLVRARTAWLSETSDSDGHLRLSHYGPIVLDLV